MQIIDLPVDPEGPCYLDFEVFVPYVHGTYAYPYISLVTGPDPRYRLERHFLSHVRPFWHGNGWIYFYMLPLVGIYEIGIKRWDSETQELLSREVSYIVFDAEDIEDISKERVIECVKHGQLLSGCISLQQVV